MGQQIQVQQKQSKNIQEYNIRKFNVLKKQNAKKQKIDQQLIFKRQRIYSMPVTNNKTQKKRHRIFAQKKKNIKYDSSNQYIKNQCPDNQLPWILALKSNVQYRKRIANKKLTDNNNSIDFQYSQFFRLPLQNFHSHQENILNLNKKQNKYKKFNRQSNFQYQQFAEIKDSGLSSQYSYKKIMKNKNHQEKNHQNHQNKQNLQPDNVLPLLNIENLIGRESVDNKKKEQNMYYLNRRSAQKEKIYNQRQRENKRIKINTDRATFPLQQQKENSFQKRSERYFSRQEFIKIGKRKLKHQKFQKAGTFSQQDFLRYKKHGKNFQSNQQDKSLLIDLKQKHYLQSR